MLSPHSYFDGTARIGSKQYVPTDQDILRSRVKTTGLTEERFQVGQVRTSQPTMDRLTLPSCSTLCLTWEDSVRSVKSGESMTPRRAQLTGAQDPLL